MRLQLLSDLHLETESFLPTPAPGADALVLAGDIDTRWRGYELFRGWPVPVLAVAGNHEFEGRELGEAVPALRARCAAAGIRLLEREQVALADPAGRRIRLLGTVRWSDYDLFGPARREWASKAGAYFLRRMRSTRHGAPLDVAGMREEALACGAWLHSALTTAPSDWDRTVVVTHFAPSLTSADPRYGAQPSTASFCNADDALLPLADLWLHGHLHVPSDYRVARPGGGETRVVSNPRGHASKHEPDRHRPWCVIEV